jgi:o-succinylbenzoate synthase
VSLVRAEIARYRLPFVGQFATASERPRLREGLLLRLTDRDGLVGLGEAAPLASFGGGTVDQTLPILLDLARASLARPAEELEQLLAQASPEPPGAAAALCAVETALLDLQAQRLGRPLAGLLSGQPARSVAVNAMLGGTAGPDQARQAAQAGFNCLKLKVGLLASEAEEVERVRAVRAAIGPRRQLRLDANGAWSVEQAIRLLDRLEPLGLALVEQPVPADDLAGLAAVRAATAIPIAADEAVRGPAQARRVIAAGAADLLVVKPMLAGGPRRALEIVALAAAAGLGALVTTTIEAGPGLALALHLAASLPAPRPACGLATAALLADDLIEPGLPIDGGRLTLPTAPGLGVRLEPDALKRYTSGWQTVTTAPAGRTAPA